MPRQISIERAGAFYHVMCRGDKREAIFSDDIDRECFLRTLGEAVKRVGWRVHAYVMMGNHYHLLLETPEPNLVRGMTWFQTTYTMRFNARHKTSGHLYGGRYKAVLVDYIHLNPVRAGLVKRVADGGAHRTLDYRWSSLVDYAAKRKGSGQDTWKWDWGQSTSVDFWIFSDYFHSMPRQPRIEFPGALYHVLARGNRRF